MRVRGLAVRLAIGLAAVVSGLLPAASANAASCFVSAGQSIQAAIDNPACDPIVVAAGIYFEHLTIGRAVTIQGAGAAGTIVDGTANGKVVDITSGPVSISGLTIRNGLAGVEGGGGIRSTAALTLTDSIVAGNEAGAGGGIRATAPLIVARSIIRDNRTPSGGAGGIYAITTTATVTDSIITGNISLFAAGIWPNNADLSLSGSTVSGNVATGGAPGGIYMTTGSATMTNSTISANQAAASGGGLWVDGASAATLNGVTVSGNSAPSGAGIRNDSGSVTIRNSIVANSTNGDCSGSTIVADHALIEDPTGCPITGDLSTSKLGVDPQLGPLVDNGGTTMTHLPSPGSPVVDAGDGTACPPADQRGAPRSGTCDIGAVELLLCQGRPVNRLGTEADDALTGTAAGDGILALGGNDRVSALGGDDGVCGGAGNDRVTGSGGKDRLSGEAGKDSLVGGGGKDRLKGGPGRDTCIGGAGRDRATCEVERKVP